MKSNAELVIDSATGFARDRKYQRQFALQHFHICARLATPAERMEPFERYRRALAKWIARRKPFKQRVYVEQEGQDFDARLLALRPECDLYLDGLWQSEAYFKDEEETIRKDLAIRAPADALNQQVAARIRGCENAVALHVRWFDAPGLQRSKHNVHPDYYQRAVAYVRARVRRAHFFLFSDDPHAAAAILQLPVDCFTGVSQNLSDENAYADMWLMTQCRHFITANSTFSWWGAWLSGKQEKIVVAPDPALLDEESAWRIGGLVPESWIRL